MNQARAALDVACGQPEMKQVPVRVNYNYYT